MHILVLSQKEENKTKIQRNLVLVFDIAMPICFYYYNVWDAWDNYVCELN